MELARMLFAQGFGSRRECAALCRRGAVEVGGVVLVDPAAEVQDEGLHFSVDGVAWQARQPAIVMLHKPAGVECSRAPRHHASVLDLLPAPLVRRGVQPVGRLDVDTTGLLLLTDDGALLHRLTAPRRHVAKVYDGTTADPVDEALLQRLREGVVLRDDPAPVRAVAAEATGAHSLRLTLAEGRYHQVKRMLAAAGHHVRALHRSGFGTLTLPPELAPGQWRWVEPDRLGVGRAG
jgi:16S rRNA pseudouridine516 synthase